MEQLAFFEPAPAAPKSESETSVDPTAYDRVIAFYSSGKDSQAMVLHLLECGVDPDKVELHHHLVDGMPGESSLMDWPITDSYASAFASTFGLKLFRSWKAGGIEREMLRNGDRTAPVVWESEDGTLRQAGGERGKLGVRRRFPQVSADLSVRWCSGYVKVDVGARVLTSEPRFLEGKTLVVTGERAEESASRARYCGYEPHRTDNRNGARVKRHIDHWRPVHQWSEERVWAILRRHNVNPHPAYHLGFGRTSCMTCIFGSPNQWATIEKIAPAKFERIAQYEEEFGCTIHRTLSVRQQAAKGTPYAVTPELVDLAMSTTYPKELLLTKPGEWKYPLGAFGESAGPT